MTSLVWRLPIRPVPPLSIEDQGEVEELEHEMVRLEREERPVAREAVAMALFLARRQ